MHCSKGITIGEQYEAIQRVTAASFVRTPKDLAGLFPQLETGAQRQIDSVRHTTACC